MMQALCARFAPIALFTLAVTLSACSHSSSGVGKDTLVVIENQDPPTLNPIYAYDAISLNAISLIFEPLAKFDSNYQLLPCLALSWRHSPDALHWTIQLRKGVTWSDGAPFTSKDVVWTWQTMLNPAALDPLIGQYAYIKRVQAEGPYSVRFDLKTRNALFLSRILTGSILPEHILDKYPASAQRGNGFSEHPIGTGPYVLSQWQHDEKILFVRNPRWWRGRARISKILLNTVFDSNAATDALRKGEAQVVQVDPQTAAELRGNPHFRIVTRLQLAVIYIAASYRLHALKDNHLLQAMMYGWDRAQLVRRLYRGDARVATGIVPPGVTYYYDPHVRLYPYDPARARAILEREGWLPGRDGIRSRRGVRLAFTYDILGRDGTSEDLAAEFQADMHDIGIGISVETLDLSTLMLKGPSGDFDLTQAGWGGFPDPDAFLLLDSSQFTPAGINASHYSDPEVDRDLREGLMHFDPRQRKVYYDDLQRRTAEHLPFLFGINPYLHYAFSRRVHVDPQSIHLDRLFYNIDDWNLSP